MMRDGRIISISIQNELLDSLDTARGDISRSTFIGKCVDAALHGCDIEFYKVKFSRKQEGAP